MKTCLDNGLRLVNEEVKGVRSVSLGIAFQTGSVHEDKRQSGISHLIEH
ncbi:insulinase family protein, partial [candidate division WOR-3 bacterium]|nr:insulinase family protein [candidate division WOR-3 bacterium]